MKKALKYLLVSSLLGVALAIALSLQAATSKVTAEDKAAGTTKQATEKTKRDWYPFYGTVASIDKQANTISLKKKEGERVLKLDAKSELIIDDKPATLGSVKVGNYAHGTLHKNSAGNEVIKAAKFDKEAPKKAKKAANTGTQETPASKSTK